MRIRTISNRLREREGIAATIARGGLSCPATIVLAKGQNGANVQREFSVESDSQDMLIHAADYAPTGERTAPELDDLITYVSVLSGQSVTYRVLIPDGVRRCFRECDAEGTELRVFTKLYGA